MINTFLKAKWENLIMVNYEIDSFLLNPYLPKGVELDNFQGKTLISLVGFLFKNTTVFNVPIPFLGTFEEINLRFYVVRKIGNKVRRGVVFINETVPYKLVARIANKLYKEHYTAVPTNHTWLENQIEKEIKYQMKVNSVWNTFKVISSIHKEEMTKGSVEEFILEHYYGYTRVNNFQSIEYKIKHPKWDVYPIYNHFIDFDFSSIYGEDFISLNNIKPHSVILAEGSDISVDWKRIKF
jgi:uncharacterized protein YqjF (DUF2071 family)